MMYGKSLGLVTIAAMILMAMVGTASATQLTGAGGVILGEGTTFGAEAENSVTMHTPMGDITCKKSVMGGKTEGGGSTTTVGIPLNTLTFSECNATVTVLQWGRLEIHTQTASNNNNGTLTSNGTEVTVVYLGFHCIYTTENTHMGTVTGSATTGGNATLDIEGLVPRTGGNSGAFCGKTGLWTAGYKITTPATLNVH